MSEARAVPRRHLRRARGVELKFTQLDLVDLLSHLIHNSDLGGFNMADLTAVVYEDEGVVTWVEVYMGEDAAYQEVIKHVLSQLERGFYATWREELEARIQDASSFLDYFNEVQHMADAFNFIHVEPVRNNPFESTESREEVG